MEQKRAGFTLLDMNGYQWTVLFAAWLGWGFDVFDGLLFNYVAPNCVPTLLDLEIGTEAARKAEVFWTGTLSSLLLVGWAIGGIAFGRVADRIGRTRTLLLTMLLYSLGTAACAFAPNIWVLALCRLVASLGIGGEWAAGAAMVAEVVPEKRRVEAGALLYTSAPLGLFLATFVDWFVGSYAFGSDPSMSWRYVFLTGLIPAGAALAVRAFVKEPERWKNVAAAVSPPRVLELFGPKWIRLTMSGFSMALVALVMWWTCNAFIGTVSNGLAAMAGAAENLTKPEVRALGAQYKTFATSAFNLGGLVGTLLTIPAAKYLGRRSMFAIYFLGSAFAIFATFGLPMPPGTRLYFYFLIGLAVFGVFGSFTYYLPELFPTRLRGLGAGFCYNAGRIIAAGGPFLVGVVAARGEHALTTALWLLTGVAVVPLLGVLALPWVVETRDRALED